MPRLILLLRISGILLWLLGCHCLPAVTATVAVKSSVKTMPCVVIPMIYDQVRPFVGSLAPVMRGKKWGCIDLDGKLHIACQYDNIKVLSPRMIGVMRAGKWGIVNEAGKEILAPQATSVARQTDTLAIVTHDWKHTYLVDATGKKIQTLHQDNLMPLSERLLGTQVGQKWGIVTVTGKVVISPRFDEIGRFGNGLAVIARGKKYGYINERGKVLIPPRYDYAEMFAEERAMVSSGKKYGFIDLHGKPITPIKYDRVTSFEHGFTAVHIGGYSDSIYGYTGKYWGFIDRTGKEVVPVKYEAVDFSRTGPRIAENVRMGPHRIVYGDFYAVDAHGKPIHLKHYNTTTRLSNGLIIVGKHRDVPNNPEANRYHIYDLYGVVDRNGHQVIPVRYDEITLLADNILKVRYGSTFEPPGEMPHLDGGKFGILDARGHLLLPIQYDSIGNAISSGMIEVAMHGKWGYARLSLSHAADRNKTGSAK